MSLDEFRKSLQAKNPPEKINPLLTAMWHDAKGDWNRAHEIAQKIETPLGSRVHAYLHRREGDESNAGYWYHRASTSFSKLSLEKEWDEIVATLLQA